MKALASQVLADLRDVATLALVGVVIALGALLIAPPPTWRIALGRAISITGLAVAGASILVLSPELSRTGQIGVAAMLASLGTTALERLFARITGEKQ